MVVSARSTTRSPRAATTGVGETQLRVAVTDPDDACRDPARPVVHRQPCPVGDRLELLEGHLEAIGARKGAGGDEGVSPADVAALDAGQARGDALPGRGTLYRDVVHLNGAHAHVAPGRLEPELVARADGARPERPRDHRPDAAQGEDSVDEEPCGKVGPALLDLGRDRGERRTELVEPCAGHAADRDDGRAGNELAVAPPPPAPASPRRRRPTS